MAKYRVIRLIEIEYESFEKYQEDSARWALPINGVRRFGKTAIYRCSTTPVEEMPNDAVEA
jgi:hypothetical protein